MADKTKKKKKERPFKPISWLYRLGLRLFGLYLRVFRGVHIDKSEIKDLKAPYLVIANHESMVDFYGKRGFDLIDSENSRGYMRGLFANRLDSL